MVSIETLAHEMVVADQRAALSRVMGEYDAAEYWAGRVVEISEAIERREAADRAVVRELGVS